MRRPLPQTLAQPAGEPSFEEPILYVAEPPASYAHRPLLVVDTSVVAAVLFRETRSALATATLQARALIAPHLLDYEVVSVAIKKFARGVLSAEEVSGAFDDLRDLVIERHAIPAGPVFALARRYALTACDASYLWLAEHLEAPLATFDARLAAAAARHLPSDRTR